MTVKEYIEEHWDKTVRCQREGDGRIEGLPYPYFVPSVTGAFQELYYWDTYFTGRGLLLCGREALLKNTVDDMLYLVNEHGYMPNGSHHSLIGRSQPPFLSEMVKDVYQVYHDPVWLYSAYRMLEREYDFWMTHRMTSCGLNRYGYNIHEGNIASLVDMIKTRLSGYDFSSWSDEAIVENVMCDAESGWDFNPRCELPHMEEKDAFFKMHQTEFVQVDLNSLLYAFEKNMAFFADELQNGEGNLFRKRADERLEKMQSLYDGCAFMDWHYTTGEHSRIFSAASFYPLWAGLATKEQAASTFGELSRIERPFGVAACEKGVRSTAYQWDYPNGWAPMHYIVVHGLKRYGYKEAAERIAKKYTDTVERIFKKTGTLWEKYNVEEGSLNVTDEYKMPEMLGWTAGVYMDFKQLLGEL